MAQCSDRRSVIDLLAALHEVRGRKKLQKIVYLLETFGAPFQVQFEFHFYGPYSEQLANEVQWLVDAGHVLETEKKSAGYSEYTYQVGGDDPSQRLEECFLLAAQDMNTKSARFLELAATIRYLVQSGLDVRLAELRAREMKPSQRYTDDEVQEAVQCLRAWGEMSERRAAG